MSNFYVLLRFVMLAIALTYGGVLHVYASAKAGEAEVYEGKTATIYLADTYQRTLRNSRVLSYSWTSDNSSYVIVTGSTQNYARIKGVKPTSSCKVYFKCSYVIDGFYRTMDFYYTVEVKSTSVSVTNISLNRSNAQLTAGSTLQLTADIYPTNATNKNVNWSSSNTSVASVDSRGLVTAKKAGSATITCRVADGSGKYATCSITVNAHVEPESIVLNTNELTLYEGETFQLEAEIIPVDATDKRLEWMTDDEKVVNVSSDGTVTALREGSARIFVKTVNGLVGSCAVTVKKHADAVFTDWSGHYIVSSNHVISYPTQEYNDDFEMTIENKNDRYFVTSMFGEDLTAYNDGGFLLHDNGNGTATIDISYYNILKSAGKDFPLYAIYVFDEDSNDWSDKWHFRMGDDGCIMIEDFYVASFTWNEDAEIWEDGKLETLYYNLSADKVSAGIHSVDEKTFGVRVDDGSIIFDDVVKVRVFRVDGAQVYSGATDRVDSLDEGIYIVKYDGGCKKIIVR